MFEITVVYKVPYAVKSAIVAILNWFLSQEDGWGGFGNTYTYHRAGGDYTFTIEKKGITVSYGGYIHRMAGCFDFMFTPRQDVTVSNLVTDGFADLTLWWRGTTITLTNGVVTNANNNTDKTLNEIWAEYYAVLEPDVFEY